MNLGNLERPSYAVVALLAACLMVLGLVALVPDSAVAQPPAPTDTLSIVKDETLPSNAEIAVAIADDTLAQADTVLISRDDEFADALASGVMQSDKPLLLVPPAGPVPDGVKATITRLGATNAIILGGTNAITEGVADELRALGLDIERLQGDSRFETAIDVAATKAPAADTIMLARAFPAPDSADASQGFADTLAAGGVSARTGFPVLLTQTDVLTGPTRDYLDQARPGRVLILGGTAAISQTVQDQLAAMGLDVQRVAGDSRASTAIEIAKIDGDTTAADTARVIVTDGQGPNAWAAGFALASHAAKFDAPIVLTVGQVVPPATAGFLSSGINGNPDSGPVLTCAVTPSLCEEVRVTAQLPPAALIQVGPLPFDLADGEFTETPFTARVGQRVGIGYDELATADPDGDACIELELIDPDDRVIQSLTNGFSNCVAQDRRQGAQTPAFILEDGVYRLRVTAADGPLSGRVYSTSSLGGNISVDGPSVPIALDRPGSSRRLTFTGQTGDVLGIGYDGLATTDTDGNACVTLELIDPDGRTLQSFTNGFSNCVQQERRDGARDPVRLLQDGQYVIELTFQDGDPGSVDVFLSSRVLDDIQVDGPLVEVATTRPGQVHRAIFTGQIGDVVGLGYDNLSTTDADGNACIEMELTDPDGRVIQSFTNGFSNCVAQNRRDGVQAPVRLLQDGTFFVETTFQEGDPGSVEVYVSRVEVASTSVGGVPVGLNFDRPGQTLLATFTTQTSQTVQVGYQDFSTPDTDGNACITLVLTDTDGNQLASLTNGFSHCVAQSRSEATDPVTIPPGEYTLRAALQEGDPGSVAVFVRSAG